MREGTFYRGQCFLALRMPTSLLRDCATTVAGRLRKPDRSRIKTTAENVNRMIFAIEESSTRRQVGAVHAPQLRR